MSGPAAQRRKWELFLVSVRIASRPRVRVVPHQTSSPLIIMSSIGQKRRLTGKRTSLFDMSLEKFILFRGSD